MGEAIAAALLATGLGLATPARAAARADSPGAALAGITAAPVWPSGREGRAADRWIAEDKARHLATSYAVAVFGYATARAAGFGEDPALGAALGGAIVAGIGKEIRDQRLGGPFSFRDLVADAAGIAAALLVLRASR